MGEQVGLSAYVDTSVAVDIDARPVGVDHDLSETFA
jgi:hypothetical protein